MDDTLSTQEFAQQEGVSRRTVQRWIQQGLIFAVKIDGGFRIPIDEQPPSFYRQQDLTNSDVQPLPSTVSPTSAGFPTEETPERFRPEPTDFFDEEEDEEEDDECRNPEDFDIHDLRKAFSTEEEAESYAGDIPVPTEIFRRCSDRFFQVVIVY